MPLESLPERTPDIIRLKQHRKKFFDYRILSPVLASLNYIAKNIDIEKYSVAERELEKAFQEEGYKNFAYVFEQLADYNVVVLPQTYRRGDEEILAKILKIVRGWNTIRVMKLTRLLMEKADVLEKFGHPLSQIAYVLENAPTNIKITEIDDKKIEGLVKTPASISVGVGGKYEKREIKTLYMHGNIDTVRTAVSMVLDSVDKPTLLIVSDRELEALGAETLLNAVVANPNLVILTFLPTRPSEEFIKLITSERVASINMPIMYASMKTHIINAYLEVAKKLMPGIKDVVRRRANTKRNLAYTIQLLVETGLLQRAVGIYVYRLVNPMLVMSATNKLIAKTYALLQRSPQKILGFYRRADRRTKRMIRNELVEVIDTLIEEAEAETVMESLNQSAISTIHAMLLKLSTPKRIYALMKSETLWELDYPILFNKENEYKVIEFMRKTGVLAVKATRHGYYTLTPGIKYLYNTIKSMMSVEELSNKIEKTG